VPTPFYHLQIADVLLEHPLLDERLRHFLHRQRGAFFLGNTAPDVQTISGQTRQATHFYTLGGSGKKLLPWQALLRQYPGLACPAALSPGQVAFLMGYICHLAADWRWLGAIFEPIFGPACAWGQREQRLYIHNVLRAYLDLQIFPALPPGLGQALSQASPSRWLPFVQDEHLRRWRDFLAGQLEPGARPQTVEVFAARQGIAPEQFYLLLASESRMDEEVFARISRQELQSYQQGVIADSLEILLEYWQALDCQSENLVLRLPQPA